MIVFPEMTEFSAPKMTIAPSVASVTVFPDTVDDPQAKEIPSA